MNANQIGDPAAPAVHRLEMSDPELALVVTALELLESTLGHEEADELEETQALLERFRAIAG